MCKGVTIVGVVTFLATAGVANAAGLDTSTDAGFGVTAADGGRGSDTAALADVLRSAGLDVSALDLLDGEPRFHPWYPARLAEHWKEQYPRGSSFSGTILAVIGGAPDDLTEPDEPAPPVGTEAGGDWSFRAVPWHTRPLAAVGATDSPTRDANTVTSPELPDADIGSWLTSGTPRDVAGSLRKAASRDFWQPARQQEDVPDYERFPDAEREGRAAATRHAAAVSPDRR